jgi:anti-anti-sigma factor
MVDHHPATERPVDVSVSHVDDVAVVTVAGELDLAGAPPVAGALEIVSPSARRVVLDLASLEFIDSVGVTLAVRARARAGERDQDFVVAGAGPGILRVFQLAGVDDHLRFAPDVRAALY